MSIEDRILKSMQRSRRRADAAKCDNGFRSMMQFVGSFGLDRKEGRAVLDSLHAQGLIERKQFANGVFWRAVAACDRPRLADATTTYATVIDLPGDDFLQQGDAS